MKRTLFLLTLLVAGSFAQERLSPELLELLHSPSPEARGKRNADAPLDVIVQYHEGAGPQKGRPGRLKRAYENLSAQVLSISPSRLEDLLADPAVAYVTPDREVFGSSSATVGLNELRPVVGLPDVPASDTGAGIGIAILDSGIVSGDRFFNAPPNCTASRIVHSQNFVPGQTSAVDSYGHGTHVAGIIGGHGRCISSSMSLLVSAGAQPFSGIAPRANLINLRVLDSNGRGTDSAVIAAIDRAIALRTTHNIRVMNLSLGRFIRESFTRDPLCQAVERAWKAGIIVVVAAGNNGRDNSMNTQGYSTITSPGNSPWVITVGAARFDGLSVRRGEATIASYSSKGPTLRDQVVKPDLVAPGNRVISRVGTNASLRKFSDNLLITVVNMNNVEPAFILSGTSMAAPVVAGTAALMVAKDTTLTPDQVKARLMKTSWKGFPNTARIYSFPSDVYDVQHDVFTVGSGLVDVNAALASTEKIPATSSALSPRVVQVNGKVTLSKDYAGVAGNTIVWGESVVWGENVVWGSNIILGNNVVWGSTVVWGSSNTQGHSVVWGESVVWGSGDPFSEALAAAGDQ